ncbi:Rib/alpha-like domain-containing protein [Corynebacterium nasicanis]|uniref:Rib/alpha-like domain-containing protein n=1 Tax=Corynebacterium nasicanis TaxID=1448267 RepID=A0ABW1QEP4_9CORY
MIFSRSVAGVAALALAATTALTAPAASALPTTPVTPPNGTAGTCDVTLSTKSNVPGSAGGQNLKSIPGTLAIGVQNWATGDAPGFRPFIRAVGNAERWMTDTNVSFVTTGGEGTYSVRPHNDPLPATLFTVPISHAFDPVPGANGNFTADLGDFNARAVGWGAHQTSAALWYVQGPAGALANGASVDGEFTVTTTLLPWPQENADCQPLGVAADAPRTVVADNSPQDTGARVTEGDATDHARMSGIVYLPGTDTPVEGAVVTVNPDGTVSVSLPPAARALGTALEIQLRANPREDDAQWEAYNVSWNVGERFTVNLGDQAAAHNPGYRHAVTHPAVAITLQQNYDLTMPAGTVYEIVDAPQTDPVSDEWTYVVDRTTGALTVTPPAGAKVGDYIVVPVRVTYPDGTSETIDGHVTVVEPGTAPGGDDGSSVDGRCIATAGAVITPLVLLAPLAAASQMEIPGVSPLIRQLQAQLQRANTDLQRGLGIHNPEIVRLVEQINGALGPDAVRILGGAGVAALSLLAIGVIADACLPGEGGSSGSSLSSE